MICITVRAVARSLAAHPIELYEKKMRAVHSVVSTFHMTIFLALGLNLDSTTPEVKIPSAENTRPTIPVYKLKGN